MIHAHMAAGVLDDTRERQQEPTTTLTRAEAKRIAAPLRKGISHLPRKEYLERLSARLRAFAASQDVDLPTPDTRSAFWSYRLENHPNLDLESGEELYSMNLAASYTEAQNSIVEDTLRYLEGTPGGKALEELRLWDPKVRAALKLNKETGLSVAYETWGALSKEYAATTENEALFFMAELNPAAVAYQTEAPQLRQDGKLDLVTFMYPPPMEKYADLAPETRELIASDAVRAQVHTFWYDEASSKYTPLTKAGHLDLEHLKSLPTPETQRAAVLEVCARVAAMDGPARAGDVERYIEEIKDLRPDHEVVLPSPADLAWAAEGREQPKPTVSTHGVYLPGVEVDAKVAAQPSTPSEAAPQAAAGMHFLPGVTLKPTPAPTTPAFTAPVQAPPTPEQAQAAGMGE